MRSKFGKYIPFLFLLILVFTLGNIFFTYKNLRAVWENEKAVEHTTIVRLAIKNALNDTYKAELEQKNFFLTKIMQSTKSTTMYLPHS